MVYTMYCKSTPCIFSEMKCDTKEDKVSVHCTVCTVLWYIKKDPLGFTVKPSNL